MSVLNKHVMVLNKLWQSIRIITVKRAIKLIFANRASVVHPGDYTIYDWNNWINLPISEKDLFIVSAKGNILLPKIIVLSKYEKIPKREIRLTKRNIFIRDRFFCQYSNKKVNYKDADVDHIIPKSKGGKDSWDNLVVCNKEINRKKGNKTPEEAGIKLIKKPKKPEFSPLFIDPNIEIYDCWKDFI